MIEISGKTIYLWYSKTTLSIIIKFNFKVNPKAKNNSRHALGLEQTPESQKTINVGPILFV